MSKELPLNPRPWGCQLPFRWFVHRPVAGERLFASALCCGVLLFVTSCGDSSNSAVDLGLPLDQTTVLNDLDQPAIDSTPPIQPVVDLRGDVNRDGVVDLLDPTDDEKEETWDVTHGVIFLANIDDDQKICPKVNNRLSDDKLAACHDAADEVINGAEDLKDLTRMKIAPWSEAPDDVIATLALSLPGAAAGVEPLNFVRIFKGTDETAVVLSMGTELKAEELRQGVDLMIEGRDILRDSSIWTGYVDLTLEIRYLDGGEVHSQKDVVRLRLAPLLTSHHLQAAEAFFVSGLNDSDASQFRVELQQALQAAAFTGDLIQISEDDQWTQDLFETGWMSMPAAAGEQHVITIYLRSANVEDPQDKVAPLRYAGREIFKLRGPDVGVVQQYLLTHDEDMDSLDSLGNLETVPPYTHPGGEAFPMGRMIMGRVPKLYPDPTFTRLLESQQVQPPLWVDTSWLLVGHVDETISFVKAATPRGWKLVLNDPALARQMLEDAVSKGHGAVKMFEGKYWLPDWGAPYSATVTIDEVLADTEVMAESAKAEVEIQAQLETLKKEIGISEEEIIRIPYLHYPVYGYSVAYQPGTVNGTVLADDHYATPDPYGPVINGQDIFKQQMSEAFAPYGITVHFLEDWDLYHRLMGEVHCGSNARRAVPTQTKWWESGR